MVLDEFKTKSWSCVCRIFGLKSIVSKTYEDTFHSNQSNIQNKIRKNSLYSISFLHIRPHSENHSSKQFENHNSDQTLDEIFHTQFTIFSSVISSLFEQYYKTCCKYPIGWHSKFWVWSCNELCNKSCGSLGDCGLFKREAIVRSSTFCIVCRCVNYIGVVRWYVEHNEFRSQSLRMIVCTAKNLMWIDK